MKAAVLYKAGLPLVIEQANEVFNEAFTGTVARSIITF